MDRVYASIDYRYRYVSVYLRENTDWQLVVRVCYYCIIASIEYYNGSHLGSFLYKDGKEKQV